MFACQFYKFNDLIGVTMNVTKPEYLVSWERPNLNNQIMLI